MPCKARRETDLTISAHPRTLPHCARIRPCSGDAFRVLGEKEVDDAVCGVLSPEVVANSEAEVVFGTGGGGALNDISYSSVGN